MSTKYDCHLTKLLNSMLSSTFWKKKHEYNSCPRSTSLKLWRVFVQDIWTVIQSLLQVSNRMCQWLSEYSTILQICVLYWGVDTFLYWLSVEWQIYENCFSLMQTCLKIRATQIFLQGNVHSKATWDIVMGCLGG